MRKQRRGMGRESSTLGPSVKERLAAGKALREKVPRTSHGRWKPPPGRRDPIELLKHTDRGRLADLLPIRYGRMCQSPFAFLRGAAALMAADLAATPATGIRVQACGDCHVANFGGFGSPGAPACLRYQRLRRNAARAVGMGREATGREQSSGGSRGRTLSERHCADAARAAVESYREAHARIRRRCARSKFGTRISTPEIFIDEAKTPAAKKRWKKTEDKAKRQTAEHVFPKITARPKRPPADHRPALL